MEWHFIKDTVFHDDEDTIYLIYSPVDGMGLAKRHRFGSSITFIWLYKRVDSDKTCRTATHYMIIEAPKGK